MKVASVGLRAWCDAVAWPAAGCVVSGEGRGQGVVMAGGRQPVRTIAGYHRVWIVDGVVMVFMSQSSHVPRTSTMLPA